MQSEISIYEFPQYKNFGENISVIEVSWDINESKPVIFNVTDSESIKNILDMYKNTVFEKAGTEPSDGNHSTLTFIDAENKKTTLSLSQIRYGNKNCYYSYPDSSIKNYIMQLGTELKVI